MLQDLILLLDYPGPLFVVLMTGAAIGMAVERVVESGRKAERSAYWRGRRHQAGKSWKPKSEGKSAERHPKAVPDKPSLMRRTSFAS